MSETRLPASLSPSEVRQVEQVCDRFEAAWKAGERPRLEQYLDAADESLWSTLLHQLLPLEWEYRLRVGDRPHAAEYAARFPGVSALVEAVDRETAAAARTLPGTCVPAPAAAGSVPRRLGKYHLLREVGRGGMGVVYEAVHEPLGRRVAIKLLPGMAVTDPTARQRLRREAQTTARLHHPNIVQIFEVGEHDGDPFLALEFIDGPSLADRLRDAPLPPPEAAALVETLARAVHYAHEQGVIHRDLKPSNVLLAPASSRDSDSSRPEAGAHWVFKIADFGLAHPAGGGDLTATGVIVGTPGYMAPEQARGKNDQRPVGPAADVYALGAVLYECLTGRPPFQGATVLEALEHARSQEPVPPTRLRPKVPRDLETVCLKCLEKEPVRRYATAAELAEELRRFQAGEPIAARPAGWAERALKWARRRPTAAALLGVSLTAALALLGVIIAFSAALADQNQDLTRREAEATAARNQAEEEKRKADVAAALAQKQRDRAREHLFTAQLLRVALVHEKEPEKGLEFLHDYDACPIDLRDAAWHYYDNACRGRKPISVARGNRSREAGSVAFSPDGKLLATAGSGRVVHLWDAATGEKRATLNRETANVLAVAFSPDGKTIALACEDGVVRLWDAVTGEEIATLPGHGGAAISVAFSPDGKTLASACRHERVVRLWDVVTGQARADLPDRSGLVRFMAFSPDGRTLATGDDATAVHLWDTATGEERANLRHGVVAVAGAFSPDGRILATAGTDKTVRLWDVTIGREHAVLKHADAVWSVSFSPDGRTLATGDSAGAVRLWEVVSGKERAVLGHPGEVVAVAFSRDGCTLASASADGTARLWPVSPRQPHASLPGHRGEVRSLAFSPDGKVLASSGGFDGTVRLWDAGTGQEHAVIREKAIGSVAISPDGHTLATGGLIGAVRLWDMNTGRELTILASHKPGNVSVAFSPNGRTLASAGGDGEVILWDVTTGQSRGTFRGHTSAIWSVAFSPDGKTLATGGGDGTVRLWDVDTGRMRTALAGQKSGNVSVAFSPDGRTLASGRWSIDNRGDVKLWDVDTGRERLTLQGFTGGVWSVAFSPDGRTLASADDDQAARLWDVATGRLLAALKGPPGQVQCVAFSPAGGLLASGSGGAVRLWRTDSIPDAGP